MLMTLKVNVERKVDEIPSHTHTNDNVGQGYLLCEETK